MAERLDIYLQRNEGWARSIRLTDTDDQPINLTDTTLAMQVREKLTQNLVAAAQIAVTNAANGEAAITLPGGFDTPLGQYGSPIQTANLHHDLVWTDSLGNAIVLFSGLLVLSRGETRA